MRDARDATSLECVTMTIVAPCRFTRSRIVSTSSALAESRLPVGSSSSTTLGSDDERPRDRDALLLAARELGREVVGSVGEPDLAEGLEQRGRGARGPRRPRTRAEARRSCNAVERGRRLYAWKTKPMRSAADAGAARLVERGDLLPDQPVGAGRRAGRGSRRMPSSVVFPEPGRAHDRDELALANDEAHDREAPRPRPRRCRRPS